MSKELLAKDKRRWSKRKGITVAAAVVGGFALVGLGYYLYRKVFYDAKTPGRTDWSGCFEPPDWVQPRPAFSCGQKVSDSNLNESGYITDRIWSGGVSVSRDDVYSSSYYGAQWTYGITGSDSSHEEANLQVA